MYGRRRSCGSVRAGPGHGTPGRRAALEAISTAAHNWRRQEPHRARIGSHHDLNAHNVLFSPYGLSLVDWDAAGPIDPRWELANYATLWSARADGFYDLDATVSLLAGYQEAGGHISGEEPDTLDGLIDNVESWTKQNVRWAVKTRPRRRTPMPTCSFGLCSRLP